MVTLLPDPNDSGSAAAGLADDTINNPSGETPRVT
jgi:hypothetical protein